MSDNNSFGLAIHGGAGKHKNKDHRAAIGHMREVCAYGKTMLENGAPALVAVEDLAAMLEDSGLYAAGKGTGPNSAGEYELDASIMDGATRKIGAVCALTRAFKIQSGSHGPFSSTHHML